MMLRQSATAQELAPLKRNRAKEAYVVHEFIAPSKIACGNSHSLYVAMKIDEDDQPETKVFGWGSNRHNPLGLNKEVEAAYIYEESHGSMGQPPWRTRQEVPSAQVFCNQQPDEAKEARRTCLKGKIPECPTLEKALKGEHAQDWTVFEVSCGNNHSMILERRNVELSGGDTLNHSRLWSFGLAGNGRLGRGPLPFLDGEAQDQEVSFADYPEEVFGEDFQVQGFGDVHVNPIVQRICCGGDFTLAIVNMMGASGEQAVAQGRVFAWGLGSFGSLGSRRKEDEWHPTEVWFPEDDPDAGLRTVTIRQVACGTKHSVAMSHEGKVYTWGHAGNGRLGHGRTNTRLGGSFSAEFVPKLVEKLSETKITFIAAGEAHTGAVDQLGGLHTWGAGAFGRCGHGMLLDTVFPSRVETLLGKATTQVAMGMMHTMSVTVQGQLYGWGKGAATGLDKGDNQDIQIPMPVTLDGAERVPVHQLAAGPLHTLVLMLDGTVFMFGCGSEHRMPSIGRGSERRDVACPKRLDMTHPDAHGYNTGYNTAFYQELAARAGGKDPKRHRAAGHPRMPLMIEAGGSNSATVLHNGELWLWGSEVLASEVEEAAPGANDDDGGEDEHNDNNIWKPQLLKKGFRNLKIIKISIGQGHALALTEELMLFSWGDGGQGQLGTGNLTKVEQPQHVTNLALVTSVSAGEEHSACIIQGGEAYSWGKAAGGRLGLGATMNEGVQMLPEQVVVKIPGTKDLRLEDVSCGSAHTCFIAEDRRVLACGAGWFGRLGQGSQDYSYSPNFVSRQDIKAQTVHCANYHTCVVDQYRGLWLMGRDTSCCQPNGRHLLDPEKFAPFENAPKRYVFQVACSDSHTLAITSQKPDTRHGTELWAWGKNSRGQLGLSEVDAPLIDLPWQLRLPGEGVSWHKFTKVATTSWHSFVVVEGKGQKANDFEVYSWGFSGDGRLGLKNNEVAHETDKAISKGHPLVKPPAKVDVRWKPRDFSGTAHTHDDDYEVPQGRKFDELLQTPSAKWLTLQQKFHAEDPENKTDALTEKSTQVGAHYTDFMADVSGLWSKPASDSKIVKEYQLRQKMRDIECQYLRTLQVLTLGKSVNAPRIEALVKTEDEVKQKLHLYEELFGILQQQPLYLCNLSCHMIGTKREELNCIVFERVVSRLFNDLRSDRTRNLFKALIRIMVKKEMAKINDVHELFDPIKSRLAPLFTQMCTNPYFMESVAYPVLDPTYEKSLMQIIVRYTLTRDGMGVRNKDPLNVTFHNGDPNANEMNYWLGGVFATNQYIYMRQEKRYRDSRVHGGKLAQERSIDEKGKGRQYFQDELKDFAKLVNGLGGEDVPYEAGADEDNMSDSDLKSRFRNVALLDWTGWKKMRRNDPQRTERTEQQEDNLRVRVMGLKSQDWEDALKQQLHVDQAYYIKDFITHFLNKIMRDEKGLNTDFQMLLVHMFQTLIGQKYADQFKASSGDWLPEVAMPIAAIVLANLIGGLLFAVVKDGRFILLRKKIEKYVLKMEKEVLTQSLHEQGAKSDKDNLKDVLEGLHDKGLVDRVMWNIEHLAMFFERCVHKHVYDSQDCSAKPPNITTEELQNLQEEPLVRESARVLREHTCKVLMSVLQERASSETSKPFHKDETETQLTVDLYTSHYSLEKQVISMPTRDMLLLVNSLYACMEPDHHNPDNPPVRTDDADRDRVCKLVYAILPQEKTDVGPGGTKKLRTVPWNQGFIAIAEKGGERHNFTMPMRFLEYKNSGPEEPTFCGVTQAPIPRSLCEREQKMRSGVRVVKPLRPNKGQEYDVPEIGKGQFPYVELMNLLEELSGSFKGDDACPTVKCPIHGSTFAELANGFQEVQSKIAADLEDSGGGGFDPAILQKLENGKIFVNKIRESMEEKDLYEFIDGETRKRHDYNAYLTALQVGVQKINAAQENYRKSLKEKHDLLYTINATTEICDVPEEIVGALQIYQERPKFIDAKKAKLRKNKTDATPAQKVLEELIRNSNDSGKVNIEKLKEMVGFPARTFNKKELEAKGVLVQLNELIPAGVRKEMKFTFQFDQEAYIVRVFVKTTLLREFTISRQDLELMSHGWKNAVMPYGDEFVWLNCFRLRRLLAFVMAEGGL